MDEYLPAMSTLICPTCQQVLPKTAVMCPNCGNRSLAPNTATPSAAPSGTFTPTANSAPWATSTHANYPANSQPTQSQPYANTPAYEPPFAPAEPVAEPSYQPNQPVYEQAAPTPYKAAETLPTPANRRASLMVYAGFMRRALALVFDWVIVGVLIALAYQFALPPLLAQFKIRALNDQALFAAGFGIYWLYHAVLTCVSRQATVGKIIMGLWVFDMQGQRIGLLRALWRELIKPLLLPFAFILWFTARKQTLHDLLAGTVVLFDR